MNDKYILDGKTPVLCNDLMQWATWFETADRHVAKDQVGESRISTVFLGLDHGLGRGAPELFETMVFGGDKDGECVRYATWEEAEAGHNKMVEEVQS